ncbi:major facilitator superfamily domain-containing protein [Circinella umbellata]|nr:major facilitator superfamily domain-containing protein [Circinella umbellata]
MNDSKDKTVDGYTDMTKEQFKEETVTVTESINEEKEEYDSSTLPDGGYGWFIVLAAVIIQIIGLGVGQSWGVIQNHFDQHDFQNMTVQLSFVGTIANIFLNCFGPVAQLLLAVLHIRIVLAIAILLCTAGLLGASWSTEIWHLYLTQGVLYGMGESIIFYIVMSIVPEWFNKRRGLALGIASTGQSLGSLVSPLVITALTAKLDVQWCYRILSLMMFVSGTIACILFKERHTADHSSKKSPSKEKPKLRDIFQFRVLRNPTFILWCMADILFEGAYYVPYYFLPAHATYLQLSPEKGSALISVMSASNLCGRLFCGYVGDRIGHINTVIIYGFITMLTCLLMWTFAENYGLLMTFAGFFGFFGSAFLTLVSAVTAVVVGIDQLQSAFSAFLVVTVVCMLGPTAAASLELATAWKPFLSYELFTGFGYAVGVIFMLAVKLMIDKRFLKIV